jgi:hypothetical protein
VGEWGGRHRQSGFAGQKARPGFKLGHVSASAFCPRLRACRGLKLPVGREVAEQPELHVSYCPLGSRGRSYRSLKTAGTDRARVLYEGRSPGQNSEDAALKVAAAKRMTEPPQLIEARRLKVLGKAEFKAGNYSAALRHYHQVVPTLKEAAAVVLMPTGLQIWLQVHGLDGAALRVVEAFNNANVPKLDEAVLAEVCVENLVSAAKTKVGIFADRQPQTCSQPERWQVLR